MGRKPTPDKTRDRRNPATSAKAVAGLADRLGPRCAAPGRDRISPVATRYRQDLYAAAVCGLLLLAVLAVFLPTVGYDFVNFDDNEYVYDNPHVANGLTAEGFVWAFTTAHANNWHPLTWLSHALDCQLYDLQPWGHHLTNVLLHAATAILLFLVLRRMTGDLWPSAFVAAVFAVHPLRAESVAWVSERKDVLSGLFFMLTLGAYMRYVPRPVLGCTLPDGIRIVRPGADGQADAGDTAVCTAAVGLLAAGTHFVACAFTSRCEATAARFPSSGVGIHR